MSTQPSLGAMYAEVWDKLSNKFLIDTAYSNFAMGFIVGQAEKVYIGACQAFMIRPSTDWRDWTREVTRLVCQHYQLHLVELSEQGEFWGCYSPYVGTLVLESFERYQINSKEWHHFRAQLCGVYSGNIDLEYHKRPTFNVRCEPQNE